MRREGAHHRWRGHSLHEHITVPRHGPSGTRRVAEASGFYRQVGFGWVFRPYTLAARIYACIYIVILEFATRHNHPKPLTFPSERRFRPAVVSDLLDLPISRGCILFPRPSIKTDTYGTRPFSREDIPRRVRERCWTVQRILF